MRLIEFKFGRFRGYNILIEYVSISLSGYCSDREIEKFFCYYRF